LYWAQEVGFGQSPTDGWYAKNLSSNGPVLKAPLSVRGSTDLDVFARPAFATTNTHPGIFAAYDVPPKSPGYINCSQGQHCTLELWRVGATKPTYVPGAVGAMADNIALSAGPQGRLWVAWVDSNHSTVNVVRTNEADSRFSAVTTYTTPCNGNYGLVGLSGGSWQRVDIAVQCSTKGPGLHEFVTQALPSLALGFTPTVPNTSAHKWQFLVTDVGDPVPGATVRVGTLVATTGPLGDATITIPKGQAPGSYPVTATAPNYKAATGSLTVTT
jgi:hypothetical protein